MCVSSGTGVIYIDDSQAVLGGETFFADNSADYGGAIIKFRPKCLLLRRVIKLVSSNFKHIAVSKATIISSSTLSRYVPSEERLV